MKHPRYVMPDEHVAWLQKTEAAFKKDPEARTLMALQGQADPTPDHLLEWVAREINGYARDTHHPMGCDSPTDLAQRIIDTVKRVTG